MNYAEYALTYEELEDILNTKEAALGLFLMGIFRAQNWLMKFVAPAVVREGFENSVFQARRVIPRHLGLSMAESIFDQ